MWVEMKVRGLALDPLSNMPIIILRDEEDKRSLPIWVGMFEANAIALELEKIATPRPMTHDLIKNILESVEARVLKIVVTDLKENTFFAAIHRQVGDSEITVDSRPSDAIALALRVAAPIFVEEEVVRKAKSVEVTKETEGGGRAEDPQKIKEGLGAEPPAGEPLRRALEPLGHQAWLFAPRFSNGAPDPPFVFRYPSVPAPTYPDFPLAVPFSPRLARIVRDLGIDIFHAQHPFLLGPPPRRLARGARPAPPPPC